MKRHVLAGAPEFDYDAILRQPLLPEGVACDILGVRIAVTNMHTVIEQLSRHLETYRGNYVCVTNVHATVMAHDNARYLAVQNGALMAVPDGMPLQFVCRREGFKEAQRIAGPELMPALLALSEETGYRHFFYGSTEETLERLRENLLQAFPKLQIAGMYAPPFQKLSDMSKEDLERQAERINQAGPDFVWVSLGAPKQELWMQKQCGRVHAVMLGVGAAFEFHAGTVRRAPEWMQRLYLEWLFRLTQNPRRLFSRYVKTNTRFLYLNLIRGRANRRPEKG